MKDEEIEIEVKVNSQDQRKKKRNRRKKEKDYRNNEEENINDVKEKRKMKTWKKVLLIIVFILVIVAGYLAYRTISLGGGLQGFLATLLGHNEETVKQLPKIEFLLLGESEGLTDTIMIGQYDPVEQKATLISIPRDTFTGTKLSKATSYDKINAAAHEGAEEVLKRINDITGLNIEYYVWIDTKALVELVDTIGGVWFDVPIDMKYDDPYQDLHINLKAGYQLLDGDKAEQVVRFRHNNDGSTYSYEYGMEDLGRVRTQRAFITAVMKQTLTPGNIFKVGNFVDIAYNNIETNMTLSFLKDYVPYAVNFSTEKLETDTLPGMPEKHNEVWVYVYDQEETVALIDRTFRGINVNENGEADFDTSQIRIELLNGSNTSSNLSKVNEDLTDKGYNIVKTGTAEYTSKTRIINRTNKSQTIENAIKDILTIGEIEKEESSSINVDFTIIIGNDY